MEFGFERQTHKSLMRGVVYLAFIHSLHIGLYQIPFSFLNFLCLSSPALEFASLSIYI